MLKTFFLMHCYTAHYTAKSTAWLWLKSHYFRFILPLHILRQPAVRRLRQLPQAVVFCAVQLVHGGPCDPGRLQRHLADQIPAFPDPVRRKFAEHLSLSAQIVRQIDLRLLFADRILQHQLFFAIFFQKRRFFIAVFLQPLCESFFYAFSHRNCFAPRLFFLHHLHLYFPPVMQVSDEKDYTTALRIQGSRCNFRLIKCNNRPFCLSAAAHRRASKIFTKILIYTIPPPVLDAIIVLFFIKL